jgi:hypothetical protein
VDRRVASVVQRAVQAFEEAGAVVEEVALTFDHDQRELSDLWCRLITPLNIEGLEGVKEQGVDLLGEHRDDFPPEYRSSSNRVRMYRVAPRTPAYAHLATSGAIEHWAVACCGTPLIAPSPQARGYPTRRFT